MADLSHRSGRRTGALSRRALNRGRLARAFGYAFRGLAYAWRCEPNFRLELAIGTAACALALWLKVSLVPILLASALVLSLELVNSAIEAAIDLISPAPHPLAKIAKDAAAAAVLIAALLAVAVGLWHMGPPLVQRLL